MYARGYKSVFVSLFGHEFLQWCLFHLSRRSGDNGGKNAESGSSVGGEGAVKGLGMGLPNLKTKKKGNQKVPKEAQHVSEALDKLRDQTRETVKGLESITAPKPDFGYDPLMEEWVKQFEELAGSQVFVSTFLGMRLMGSINMFQ